MSERLNLHIDESGSQNLSEGLYIVALVIHEHSADITTPIKDYENRLKIAQLENIPFHGKDLLHGNEGYGSISVADRKRLLTQFARLIRALPFSYHLLHYDASTTHNKNDLKARIRRDLAEFVFENLSYFQSFDSISVYYDDGQDAVSIALHDALEFVLAKNVVDFRDANHEERRLLQAADYICTIERASLSYGLGGISKTQERFFGNRRNFVQSYLKQLRRKRI